MSNDRYRILLIGGSSHVGKSTLSQALSSYLEWSYCSTDQLARHPGRPWQIKPKEVPQHVVEHYLSLSAEELFTDVLRHYKHTVWPYIEDIITSYSTDLSVTPLIMEGSAILPELIVTVAHKNIAAVWLTASNDLITKRIYKSSQYKTRAIYEKALIDKFLERTWLYNQYMIDTVKQFRLASLEVEEISTLKDLTDISLSLL